MKQKTDDEFTAVFCGKLRMQILKCIKFKAKNVTELSKELKINQSTLSHNLTQLEKFGFIKVEQRKKFRYYSLNGKYVPQMLELINKHMNECCNGGEEK